jgi:hypothetical protein
MPVWGEFMANVSRIKAFLISLQAAFQHHPPAVAAHLNCGESPDTEASERKTSA